MGFLPITKDELKGEPDIILVTGDAYVDHPSFGTAVIARVLEKKGYSVGIIAMPDFKNPESIAALGRPRLFFGVTSGNCDSMLSLYTAFKKRRSDDPYVPGGKAGLKPERAVIKYCNLIKAKFKDVPIVLGGIEASMRRLVHYDFWDNKLRRSLLLDSRADIIAYGMAEEAIVEIAGRIARGDSLESIAGTLTISRIKPDGALILPDQEDVMSSPEALLQMYRTFFNNQDKVLLQQCAGRFLVHYPQQFPDSRQLDGIYSLPFMYAPHPSYREPVPAFEMIIGSLNAHRGCVSGCSFCSVGLHQGKRIISRSPESVIDEASLLTRNPFFKKHIRDIGGPSANMYGFKCSASWKCNRASCIYPKLCKNLKINTSPWLDILDRASSIKGVSRATVGSGIRYDVFMMDKDSAYSLKLLTKNHISGQLKIAPEHTVRHVLDAMRKNPAYNLEVFVKRFKDETAAAGKKQYIIPYLMSCHPGCTIKDMHKMKSDVVSLFGFMPQQVQAFIPLPMTISSIIYHTGKDPLNDSILFCEKNMEKRKLQHAVLIK